MFYIVKSKQTGRCKVIHYLEDSNPNLKIVCRKSNVPGKKDFYQIQYRNGYWLMGFCNWKTMQYLGNSDVFRTLIFTSNDECVSFLRMFTENLKELLAKS